MCGIDCRPSRYEAEVAHLRCRARRGPPGGHGRGRRLRQLARRPDRLGRDGRGRGRRRHARRPRRARIVARELRAPLSRPVAVMHGNWQLRAHGARGRRAAPTWTAWSTRRSRPAATATSSAAWPATSRAARRTPRSRRSVTYSRAAVSRLVERVVARSTGRRRTRGSTSRRWTGSRSSPASRWTPPRSSSAWSRR